MAITIDEPQNLQKAIVLTASGHIYKAFYNAYQKTWINQYSEKEIPNVVKWM